MSNSIKKIILITAAMLLIASFLCSCESNIIEVNEGETYVPKAANQFALDKETEVETIEPTKAHRPYPEDFKLNPDTNIVIGEKQFLTKINYIYKNIDLFTNSTIVVEGMYGLYESWDKTFEFPMVYRNGPAEYGDDQYGGFYLVNIDQNLYKIDDWIKVTGKPFMYEHTDSEGEVQKFLFILAEQVEVITNVKERKAEMVNN